MISVGDKIEYREDGECVVIAAKKLWSLRRVRRRRGDIQAFLANAPDQWWEYAIIVDRGENSRDRYIVCVYSDDHDKTWISPYFTSCLAEAATEYNALTANNKED